MEINEGKGSVDWEIARVLCVFLPPALPDTRHVHLFPTKDVKLVIVKDVGSAVQNIWKILLYQPGRTKEQEA